MNYLWKKWREAVNAKDWAMANAYADMLDDEREDQKREKLARMKEKLKASLIGSGKTNVMTPRLNESNAAKATLAGSV